MTKLTIKDEGDVRRMRLSNPERHNAFDDGLVFDLHNAFRDVGKDDAIRAVVLASEGPSFSAGADLAWMRRMAEASRDENIADAQGLSAMLLAVRDCPKPVIARVQGAAYGGGVGLVAACDLAYALPSARFALTEVRLGLIPAVIAPFLLGKMGPGAVRTLGITGASIDAARASDLGLVHSVVDEDGLDLAINATIDRIRRTAPGAIAAWKALLQQLPGHSDPATLTAEAIADRRASAEGVAGMQAFFERTPPPWSPPRD